VKKLIRWILTSLAALLLVEGLCSVYWLARDYVDFRRNLPQAIRFDEERHVRYDPELGWVNIPGKRMRDFYGPGKHLTLNALGFRGPDITPARPPDRFRLVCLGDSFTLGYGVDDCDTWPARLQQLRPGLETVNMGSGGYSVGQCCLWFQRDGLRLRPDAVVLALVTDDIWRMAGERMINGYGKPTFWLRDGRVKIGNQPVPAKIEAGASIREGWKTLAFLEQHGGLLRGLSRIARAISMARPVATPDDAMKVALKLVEELHARLEREKIPLTLVLMPDLTELTESGSQETYLQVAARFETCARTNGIPFLSLYGKFAAASSQADSLFNTDDPWHHYSPAGYQLVAAEIDRFLSASPDPYPAR
jgi:hypothetical protein